MPCERAVGGQGTSKKVQSEAKAGRMEVQDISQVPLLVCTDS